MSEQNEVAIKRIHKTVLLFFFVPLLMQQPPTKDLFNTRLFRKIRSKNK